MSTYAELQVTTNFSFLEGASHAEELVGQARTLGYAALAITDRNSLAGVVRAHVAARDAEMRLVVGTRLDLRDGASLLCYPTDRAAYGRLCRLLTEGKRRAPKGECYLDRADVVAFSEGQILLVVPPEEPGEAFADELAQWVRICRKRVYLAGAHRFRGDDQAWLDRLARLGSRTRAPLVATNDVLYHHPHRRELQDVLACIRDGVRLKEAGWRLQANAERHLKEPVEMARLFARHPEAVMRTVEIAERCRFSMEALKYEYPEEAFEGQPPQQRLEELTWAGAAEKWPEGISDKIRADLLKELNLIRDKDYARYFLTVHDVVRFAESQNILCQGRGSAANSAVCFCLGITKVNPAKLNLLFERFLSADRDEPPDIDVDFEHERREEVIQHIYQKYGRERTALCATVIHYRRRSALRDVGKVMGLSDDVIDALAGTSQFSRHRHEHRDPRDDPEPKTMQKVQQEVEAEEEERGPLIDFEHIRQVGIDPHEPMVARTLELAGELIKFPRHLSQHVGGFVISKGRLDELGPIENAAMEDRTVLCWDKDDVDELNLVKVDVLALGMLSCLRRGLHLLRDHKGLALELDTIPDEDPATYEMLCEADSVGVFQVESRAQMTMLPRLKPKEYYDLVVEVAIVRPGPIQGGMVHPYLRRRDGIDPVSYPSPELEGVLGKTLGIPLFQEQAMNIAIIGAGFTPARADKLRKAMATFRRTGQVTYFHDEFITGMLKNGYTEEFARSVFSQIEGFGEYGFPESHAASFALLVYASAWMKRHHPEVFACAILNSQPMGFYAPAQLVRDARDHAVTVLPADVNHSDWDCTLEPTDDGLALRLGLRLVQGAGKADAEELMKHRGSGYESPHALWRRAGLRRQGLEKLAEGDCFGSMGLSRRQAGWEVRALGSAPPPLLALIPSAPAEPAPLPVAGIGEEVNADYASLKLSLKQHPLALLRHKLTGPKMFGGGIMTAETLWERHKGRIAVAGLVIGRQRPGTAKGVIFMTLEDETGIANVVIWNHVFERFRVPALASRLALVEGRVERDGKDGKVIHLVAETITDLTPMLHSLALPGAPVPRYKSRDFQ